MHSRLVAVEFPPRLTSSFRASFKNAERDEQERWLVASRDAGRLERWARNHEKRARNVVEKEIAFALVRLEVAARERDRLDTEAAETCRRLGISGHSRFMKRMDEAVAYLKATPEERLRTAAEKATGKKKPAVPGRIGRPPKTEEQRARDEEEIVRAVAVLLRVVGDPPVRRVVFPQAQAALQEASIAMSASRTRVVCTRVNEAFAAAQLQRLSSDDHSARWSIVDAAPRLSQVIERARAKPQVITRFGKPIAVVISTEEWERKTERKTERAGEIDQSLLASPLRGVENALERARDQPSDLDPERPA
jgi:prevent-host-death family protein